MSMMNKPHVVEKVRRFMKAQKKNDNRVGTIPRAITLNYSNVCNFNCEFCFSAEKDNAHIREHLDFEIIHNLEQFNNRFFKIIRPCAKALIMLGCAASVVTASLEALTVDGNLSAFRPEVYEILKRAFCFWL